MAGEYEKQKEEIKKKAIFGVTGGLFDPSSGSRRVLSEAGDYWAKELRGETAGGIPVPGYGARVAARTTPGGLFDPSSNSSRILREAKDYWVKELRGETQGGNPVPGYGARVAARAKPSSVAAFGAGKAEASVPAAAPVVKPAGDPNMVAPPVTHFGAGSGIPASDIALPQDYTEKVKALGYGSEASSVAMKGKANLGQTFTNNDLAFITGEDPTKTGPTPEEMTAIIAKRDADNAEIERGFGVSGKGVTFEDLINKSFQAGNEARAMKKTANAAAINASNEARAMKKTANAAAINASNADIEYKKGMLGVAQKPKPLDIGDMVKGFSAILTDPDATVEEKATARESLRGMLGVKQSGAKKYSQEDIEHTAKKYGLTVEEVKKKLGVT